MVTLRVEKECDEKHIRDVEKREDSLMKERHDLLECSDRKRVQKEVEILKLNDASDQSRRGGCNFAGR